MSEKLTIEEAVKIMLGGMTVKIGDCGITPRKDDNGETKIFLRFGIELALPSKEGCEVNFRDVLNLVGGLVFAAPKMYLELADLLDAMEQHLFPQAAPGVDFPAVLEKKFELRKLLAKARGEQEPPQEDPDHE